MFPALAVAEALSARGVRVTFAGSPGRIEARLVPEAGYEFDPFEISGFPRKLGMELLAAFVRAGRAPIECARILAGGGRMSSSAGAATWPGRWSTQPG